MKFFDILSLALGGGLGYILLSKKRSSKLYFILFVALVVSLYYVGMVVAKLVYPFIGKWYPSFEYFLILFWIEAFVWCALDSFRQGE